MTMDRSLIEISKSLLQSSLGVKPGELLVVVADDYKKELAEHVHQAGLELGADASLVVMKHREKSGEEPPAPVAAAMREADVAICLTQYSLTHTGARKEAAASGTRVATMPTITEDMFREGAISADYAQVRELTERVTVRLTAGSRVKIEKEHTALTFSIAGRAGVPSTGVYLNPGESGNLPSGEGYIAPVEGSASGTLLVDGSIAGLGKVTSPLTLTVENGRLVGAEGEQGEALLAVLGDGDGRLLGEFGIGTNDKARITGVVLEDEKVYGTIHVAFGSNNTFGGIVAAGVHIDLMVLSPRVYIDDELILENGRLLV